MPEMPAFLADFLEPRFARQAAVTHVDELAPRLRKVRFAGAGLRGVRFEAGQEVEMRVSERAFRHYTPSSFDATAGELEVVFFLHDGGPGSAWAKALAPGQKVGVLGPGGGFGLRSAKTHVFLGDETAIGVFAAMAQAARAVSQEVRGAIEVDDGCQEWPRAAGLDLDGAVRRGGRGAALSAWLASTGRQPPSLQGLSALSADACFYLAGHTATIARLRGELLAAGWPRRCIRTKAYWAEGKRGM